MKLKIIDFLKNKKFPYEELSELKLTVKEKDNLFMISYAIDADFSNEIVRECRGIILNKNLQPVCVPFFKFGNYCESYADEIDWSTAKVREKVDGSLIKLYYYNNCWNVATNSTIDAEDAPLHNDVAAKEIKNYKNLFFIAAKNSNLNFNILDTHYTYMFELISPFNRVVVPYKETEIVFLGARNMTTLEEEELDIGVKKPKQYPLQSLEDCLLVAQELPFTEEGYVVVDKYWHRVKIKSPAYLRAHILSNNKCITKKRLIQLARAGDKDEFVSYFPEYEKYFDELENNMQTLAKEINKEVEFAKTIHGDRSWFAANVKNLLFSDYLFIWKYKDSSMTPRQYLDSMFIGRLSGMIERIEANGL
jgi:hypothetical protein